MRFCLASRGWYNDLFDLLAGGVDGVPETGGAYVLGTSDGTMFTYPWGSSPVFYIGKADNLQNRLSEHKAHIESCSDDHERLHWWQRYQYGAAFGADCGYYSRRGPEDVQNVEADLMECFYEAFGAIPVANSAWPRRIEPKQR